MSDPTAGTAVQGGAPAVRYGRILLKLSGEALLGDRPYGVDPKFCAFIAAQVKEVLAATARPLPGSCPGGCGAGLVHPRAAVARATVQQGYTVQGAIGALHARISPSTGAPRSHERCGLAQDGCYQEFERGAVYWSADSGARWVHGGVRGAWNRAGGVNGLEELLGKNEVISAIERHKPRALDEAGQKAA